MKHLLYIISLTLTLLMVACYPRGDDDSVMGLGEKLVGTWIEDNTDTNALYYIFGNDGICTHGITQVNAQGISNSNDPETPWSKQVTNPISGLCIFIFCNVTLLKMPLPVLFCP